MNSIPDIGRTPGEGNGYILKDSGKSHGESSLQVIVHTVAKSWTQLSNRAHTHTMYIKRIKLN